MGEIMPTAAVNSFHFLLTKGTFGPFCHLCRLNLWAIQLVATPLGLIKKKLYPQKNCNFGRYK